MRAKLGSASTSFSRTHFVACFERDGVNDPDERRLRGCYGEPAHLVDFAGAIVGHFSRHNRVHHAPDDALLRVVGARSPVLGDHGPAVGQRLTQAVRAQETLAMVDNIVGQVHLKCNNVCTDEHEWPDQAQARKRVVAEDRTLGQDVTLQSAAAHPEVIHAPP